MKRVNVIVSLILTLPVFLKAQTGADCANAIPLIMDGVCRNYSTSASTATSVTCTGYTGTSPVTYFSFTTNSTPDRVLLQITSPSNSHCEVLMYSSGSCSPPLSASAMCFDDGDGLWAAAHNYTFLPNYTYTLRIKTDSSGTITICAQNYTSPNNDCPGATPIGPSYQTDNNACNIPGTGVNAADLCASTLENTAFYTYTVETTGTSFININNINCDNQAANNSTGMQIGFFTGSCGSLSPISCYSGSGSFVTASTSSLPAGTHVYVAIDGVAGSNCRYDIEAINAVILSASIKYFSGWKTNNSNLLKWLTLQEQPGVYYEVQRSEDGITYKTIGRIDGSSAMAEETEYKYEDKYPLPVTFYRLKQFTANGGVSISRIIEIKRQELTVVKIELNNPVTSDLMMKLYSDVNATYDIAIINFAGQRIFRDKIGCIKGVNSYLRSLSHLPAGLYFITASHEHTRAISSFIKLNTSGGFSVK